MCRGEKERTIGLEEMRRSREQEKGERERGKEKGRGGVKKIDKGEEETRQIWMRKKEEENGE